MKFCFEITPPMQYSAWGVEDKSRYQVQQKPKRHVKMRWYIKFILSPLLHKYWYETNM